MRPWFQTKQNLKETAILLKRWISHPLRIGALAPSSSSLSRLMAKHSVEAWKPGTWVLEIGAGTGPVTQALLEQGLPPSQLISMDIDSKMTAYLAKRFPAIRVLEGSAAFLDHVLPSDVKGNISVIVSTVPLVSLSPIVRDRIVCSCLAALTPEGSLFQLTYSPISSIAAGSYQLNAQHVARVWSNFPPGNLWRYTKQDEWS